MSAAIQWFVVWVRVYHWNCSIQMCTTKQHFKKMSTWDEVYCHVTVVASNRYKVWPLDHLDAKKAQLPFYLDFTSNTCEAELQCIQDLYMHNWWSGGYTAISYIKKILNKTKSHMTATEIYFLYTLAHHLGSPENDTLIKYNKVLVRTRSLATANEFLVHWLLSYCRCKWYVHPKRRFLQGPQGDTSQKTTFFIVTAVKTIDVI
jgi:hypothetical protein